MKLSIITINFNNSNGLQKTIESVVGQTYTNYEYIIIDGGSSDDSKDTIKLYDKKIKYWVSEPDKGVYHAMNKGIKKANGEYCLFLNSGDTLINNNVLEVVFENFPDKDIVYGNLQNSSGLDVYANQLKFSTFFYSSIGHPVSFIRRTLFDIYGTYNEKYKIVSDWEFFIIALVKNNCSYQHINTTISYFEPGGISNNPKNELLQINEREEVLRKLFPLMYDDYMELKKLRTDIIFYNNSKAIQKIKAIQQSDFYKKIRKVK